MKVYLNFISLVVLFGNLLSCAAKKDIVLTTSHSEPPNLPPKAVFGEYDFTSGDYTLYGTFWINEGVRNEMADSLGMFYINDPKILSQLQANWHFSESNDLYECGYDYTFYLTKGNSVVEEFDLNIHCSSLVSDKANYTFSKDSLSFLFGKTKKLNCYSEHFTERDEASTKLNALRKDTSYFIPYDTQRLWEKHPGYFCFSLNSPHPRDKDSTRQFVLNQLQQKFSPDQFSLQRRGYDSNGRFDYRIYCDSSLMKEFDQFEITDEFKMISLYPITAYKKL
ncbi:MAG: hypothetical protein MI810_18255 [Flavobacteriales bacterium]|nr:hypothetical protein [Flavobacteriales bacterium]